MVTVFAEGLRPSVGVRCVKAAFAGVSPGVSAGYSLAIKKPGLGGVDHNVRPTFIACLLYLPRYSAACMAMMRPELLAQEACEPGAR